VLIGLIAIPALLPSMVTPPAAVLGGRVVLARDAIPASNYEPLRVGPPLVEEARAFFISEPVKGELVAVQATWSPSEGGPECAVTAIPPFTAPVWSYSASCPPGTDVAGSPIFGPRGEPIAAPRSLARYLVSVDRDRVIVNVSREIREYGATPQPRVSPLPTP
jgi:hypothetical protein